MKHKLILLLFGLICVSLLSFVYYPLRVEPFKPKFTEDSLNETLLTISKLLNDEGFDNWFIGYGTLLGIIRNKSCINNDDDIDIIIDITNKTKILSIIDKYNFKITMNEDNFLQISANDNSPLIDFYLCDMNDHENTFNDTWEHILWTNCKPILKIDWKNSTLNIPNTPEIKLNNYYGDNWMTPDPDSKGGGREFI
jgi:hypothetical protein